MERCVALFISGRRGFFREEACINCPVEEFCACDGADVLFDIDSVMRKELVDVGQGVKMSESVKVERGLLTGNNTCASLSHDGVLAICADRAIQFADLNANKQVQMNADNYSLIGFYDGNALLLTWGEALREATVGDVFERPTIETFKEVEGTSDAIPFTDVSLLQERRVLYYYNAYYRLFAFDVDTRVSTEIDIGKKVCDIASCTGIDCGTKTVFRDCCDDCTYIWNNDNTVTRVNEDQGYSLTALFPSASNPGDIANTVFKYGEILVKNDNVINRNEPAEFARHGSVTRVYRDIFLCYDHDTSSWVLLRFAVP